MKRRPTQTDIAKATGVHRSTVSLVFSNHPSIPEETKKNILKCAKKLGYSPDPMLSALAAYRSRNRPKPFQGTVAWLTNNFSDLGQTWKDIDIFSDNYRGATSCAKAHGYKLEIFDLKQSAPTPHKLASIFRAQNIQGILVCPQLKPNIKVHFPWEHFSAVTFGYSLAYPQLHTVTSTQYRAAVRAMRELKKLGYQRIGFYFAGHHDDRTDHNYLAGYLVENFSLDSLNSIPPLLKENDENFLVWYKKYRPEAILTGHIHILELLDRLHIRTPQDVGVACAVLDSAKSPLAGVVEASFHVGEVAMNYLVSLIRNGERGIPQIPHRLHIEGTWHKGKTLRRNSR